MVLFAVVVVMVAVLVVALSVDLYDELFSCPVARAILVHVESKMAASR